MQTAVLYFCQLEQMFNSLNIVKLGETFFQGSLMTMDRYAAAEGFHKLAMAFAPVPDLHIMWLLHLCDAHQEMQSWAEAAQCAVAVAGVVMQVNYRLFIVSQKAWIL